VVHQSVKDLTPRLKTVFSILRNRKALLFAATILFATAIKLYLAATTNGTLDVAGFADQLHKVQEFGAVRAYHVRGAFNNPFNHPPFIIHYLKILGYLSEHTAIPFSFWHRLVPSLADVGTIGLISLIAARVKPASAVFTTLLLFVLCPTAILIAGYHGNTDSIFIFFLLLSVYLLEFKHRDWLAGAMFGMALNIKIAPLIFVPVIAFYCLPNLKRTLKFFISASVIFVLGSLPYLARDPFGIASVIFGYNSLYGNWGWTALLTAFYPQPPTFLHPPYDLVGIHEHFARIGKFVMFAIIILVSVQLNRRRPKPLLFHQVGLACALFLACTPGFGVQYLLWLVPFVILLERSIAIIYYCMSSLYLLAHYSCTAFAGSLPYCDPFLGALVNLGAWFTVFIVLMVYHRLYKSLQLSAMDGVVWLPEEQLPAGMIQPQLTF
jgi:hypothetical protein